MGFKSPDWSDLTPEQTAIIQLPTNVKFLIEGGPGTGKTVMAIYRAKQLSSAKKTLFLVYNKPLMQFIASAVNSLHLEHCYASTYHSWLNTFFREQFGIEYPKFDQFSPDWNSIERKCEQLGHRYEHIIIDEAQDFPVVLLRILNRLAKNITCFIDPNQAIEPGKTDTTKILRNICEAVPCSLIKNFRNSIEIGNVASLFSKNPMRVNYRGHGFLPTIFHCSNLDYQFSVMCNLIEKFDGKSIGIIVNNKDLRTIFDGLKDRLGPDSNVEVYKSMTSSTIDFDRSGVKIISYGTMKGLEFDYVLLPRFDKIKTTHDVRIDMNRVYVAMTRAIFGLYMFYTDDYCSDKYIDTLSILKKHRELLNWL